MASYLELKGLFGNGDLIGRTEVAVIVYADTLIAGTPTTAEKAWISSAYSNTNSEAKKVLKGVLAANSGFTVDQIIASSDTGANSLQEKVDVIVPILIDALAGV